MSTSASPTPRRGLIVPQLALAAVVIALDQLTKVLAVGALEGRPRVDVIGPAGLVLVRNPGAAFSMATSMTWVLTLVAIAIVVVIVRMGRRLMSWPWAIALGLVLGGALGNLVDRFIRSPGPLRGHVVDFVSVGSFPVFNVADSAITCGVALAVVLLLTGRDPDGGTGDARTETAAPILGETTDATSTRTEGAGR